jgi:hypothetical protein
MIKQDTSVPRKGMNRDAAPFELGKEEYTFALNTNFHDEHGNGPNILQNESSNVKCTGFKAGYKVIGHKYDVTTDRTYFFLTNPTQKISEIGYIQSISQIDGLTAVEDSCNCNVSVILENPLENTVQTGICTYNTLLSDYCVSTDTATNNFNFSIDHPIHEKNILIKHSKIGSSIYFTDFYNPQRYVQLDNLDIYNQDVDPCTGDTTETCLQVDKMRVFPITNKFCITPDVIQDGGNLRAGVYEVIGAYCTAEGDELSDYYSLTNPIAIHDKNNNILDQTVLDYETNKAISIFVNNQDDSFQFFKIVVIYRNALDAGVKVFQNGIYNITTNKVSIYTDKDKELLSLRTILTRKAIYNKARLLAQANGYLFQGGLEAHREINLQPIVNLMGGFVKWATVQATEDLYEDGIGVANYASYMRDEVVPLSIRFTAKGGYEYPLFPFIPRPATTSENQELGAGYPSDTNNQSVLKHNPECSENVRNKRWQFENTATITGDCEVPATGAETETEQRAIQDTCFVKDEDGNLTVVASIASSSVEYETDTDLVTYINSHIDEIIASTGPNGADIRESLQVISEASCVPVFGSNCSEDVALVDEGIFAISTTDENIVETVYSFEDYERPTSPKSCNTLQTDGTNLVRDTSFETSYMDLGETVYAKLNVLTNNSCATAASVSNLTAPQVDGLNYLQNKGEVTTNTTLKTAITVSVTNTSGQYSFSNKLHSNAIWYKINFNGRDKVILELTPTTCNTSDDNTHNALRVSFYTDCSATSDVAGYTKIIADTTLANDSNKFVQLNASDFGGNTSSCYVAIDSAMRSRTVLGNTVYTLTPPCGCFSLYTREVLYTKTINYTGLTFGKKQTYETICNFTILKLNGCNPVPYKKGNFSYWESVEKYPCNLELYDSSNLIIRPSDLPVSIQSDFQSFYTNGVSGGAYVLKTSETNFADKPIRHYKFPDSTVIPFMSYKDSSVDQNPGAFKKSIIYPIGFNINNDVINAFLDIAVNNGLLTIEERVNITGYEIFRGDRRTDRSIIAKGLLFDMYAYSDTNADQVLYPNYPLNSIGEDFYNKVSHPYLGIQNTKFTFHSPDTHFGKPSLPREMNVEGYVYGKSENYFDQVLDHSTYTILGSQAYTIATTLATAEVVLDIASQVASWLVLGSTGGLSFPAGVAAAIVAGASLVITGMFKAGELRYKWIETIRNLGKPINFAYYQVSVGHYNYFEANTVSASRLRGLPLSTYLKAGRWSATDESSSTTYSINNLDREDSIFLSVGDNSFAVNYPTSYKAYDIGANSSRTRYNGVGRSGRIVKNAASPYVSIKQYLPGQYGDITSVEWVNTGFCGDLTDNSDCNVIFGGDTYISRFSLKRKLPFFTDNAVGLPPLLPFAYSDLFNINPGDKNNRYFVDYLINNADDDYQISSYLFPSNRTYFYLDSIGSISQDVYVKPQNKFYLYSYGIPYFLVESAINCNYRYGKREKFENFYPNVGDIVDWTQEKYVSIKQPNTYFYNSVYSQGHTNYPWRMLPSNYSKETYDKLSNLENTIIYSKQDAANLGISDPWLTYKPLDTYDFSKELGKLIAIDAIESEQILVRFEHGFTIFNAVDNLRDRLTEDTKALGTGSMFDSRTMNLNKTDLGYSGSQHRDSVSNEFGHFWADAKRGQIFNIAPGGKGMKEITQGLSKWFKENLPFKLLNKFPNLTLEAMDNNYKGLGIALGWDARLKRLFVTKKDYTVINEDVKYDEGIGFYKETPCPPGYTLVGNMCTKITEIEKIPTGAVANVHSVTSSAYGWRTPAIYSAYNSNGTGNVDLGSPTGYTFTYLTDPFWTGNGNVMNSVVNKLGKWLSTSALNQWYGATSVVDVPATKTYYVMLMADNRFRFSVDGTVILTSVHQDMSPQHGLNPVEDGITFQRLHIYPIQLEMGCRLIKIEGLNLGSVGMFGAAILDNTALEIQNATSMTDLNFVYSTETETKYYQNSASTSCPRDYIDLNPESYCGLCRKTEEIPFRTSIDFDNTDYFKECSWTIAYSPLTETWISYYSFKPNYYVNYNNYFQTGINFSTDTTELGLWSHLPFLSSYQVFYGKRYPFTVEYPLISKGIQSRIDSIDYWLDVRKYYNRHDNSDIYNVGFDEAVVYNTQNNTGKLKLIPQAKNNLQQRLNYPKHNSNNIEVLQTELQGKWSFNYLYNSVKNEKSGLPIWLNDCAQVEKTLNDVVLDYRSNYRDRLRGDYYLVRLSNTLESRYKMIFRFAADSRDYYEG